MDVPRWVDDHCHLPPGEVGDAWVAEARAAGVMRLVNVGTDLEGSKQAIAMAERHDGVWATVGVHPHDARQGIDGIVGLLDHSKVVAVGEAGLDFHYDHSPRDVQRDVFAAQVALAHEFDLALVIHTRSAWEETFDVLKSGRTPQRTVFHCFSGGPDEARRCLDLGAYLSFSGIVTFPSASDVREAAMLCPRDRLLVETDSPYLAPVPLRGRGNVPANVVIVGTAIAVLRGLDPAQVALDTWTNAARLYDLP